ncbi:exodeoxyribonuclease VII large subunit [Kaistia dalseonensis]|uniref:Exodeoxyribonuclease 7 large subunit n=1 Tax=Kaistia dalseonensis TaxID=410840 RepID=A0ABU0H8B7_9HYPH|nr:exodeoxyribonuclease VII large subunit [Kaistia dalseonensis]MCX5495945.1 exodeoxyribonuclease VII large subunit [Kaistia dalseonensis]MDQ0438548.1 exodeoxyribonuclease VII large subunit [Kaistia dalseonensis]
MTEAVSNASEYSVSEISMALKRTVEDAFGYVRVRGEISGYRGPHSSGHAYFALKDDRAKLEAVIWKGNFGKLRFRPEEGMEVIATGKLTTFPGSSKYQIVIESLEPAGIGALMALLEERRKKLAAEGLFDSARKRPIPYLPRVIGVVTSPTGAVIRDILHRLADRFPVHVLVWPVRVQGETSAAEVAAAIAGFNALPEGGKIPRPDVLIVARGGGSLEDLWGFNEEIVVRAAAASDIPLISAVGHETDTTLIDFASDLRAPTPTGAAEMAVPVRSELLATTGDLDRRLAGAMARHVEARRRELRAAVRALPRLDDLLAIPRRSFDELAARIGRALSANTLAHRGRLERTAGRLSTASLDRLMTRAGDRLTALSDRQGRALEVHAERKRAVFARISGRLRIEPLSERVARGRDRLGQADERGARAFIRVTERLRDRLDRAWRLAETLSYRSVLARGFALVTDAEGRTVRAAATVTSGDALTIEFQDGKIGAVAAGGAAEPKPKKAPKAKPPTQESLF